MSLEEDIKGYGAKVAVDNGLRGRLFTQISKSGISVTELPKPERSRRGGGAGGGGSALPIVVLNVMHLGSPAYRQFNAGNAYT